MNIRTDNLGWRKPIEELKGKKVIDIGGANSYASSILHTVIDLRPALVKPKKEYNFDICNSDEWIKGEYDYAICTHTIEDVRDPITVCREISKISKAGLLVVPSKYRELSRFQGRHRGFMHHYWIFDFDENGLIAYPKHPFIEYMNFDIPQEKENHELVYEWEGEIKIRLVNDGMPFGTDKLSGEQHMMELYSKL